MITDMLLKFIIYTLKAFWALTRNNDHFWWCIKLF